MEEEILEDILSVLNQIDTSLSELRSEINLNYVEEYTVLSEVNEKLNFEDYSLLEMRETAVAYYERLEDIRLLRTYDFIFGGVLIALFIVAIIAIVLKRV